MELEAAVNPIQPGRAVDGLQEEEMAEQEPVACHHGDLGGPNLLGLAVPPGEEDLFRERTCSQDNR